MSGISSWNLIKESPCVPCVNNVLGSPPLPHPRNSIKRWHLQPSPWRNGVLRLLLALPQSISLLTAVLDNLVFLWLAGGEQHLAQRFISLMVAMACDSCLENQKIMSL